jgi:hypothetical protein
MTLINPQLLPTNYKIFSIQCADRALHAILAGSINSADRRFCQWYLFSLSKAVIIFMPNAYFEHPQTYIFCGMRWLRSYITSSSPLKVNRRYGVTHHLHLQVRRSLTRYQRESRWQDSTLHLLSRCEDESDVLKRPLTFNGLHGVISQKILLFLYVLILTSNVMTGMWSEAPSTIYSNVMYLLQI